jgi:hypothetical protein
MFGFASALTVFKVLDQPLPDARWGATSVNQIGSG